MVRVAWANVVVHVAGLVMAVLYLQPGSILAPAVERRQYHIDAPAGWTAGWAVWAAAAVAFFVFQLQCRHAVRGRWTRWSLLPAAAAVLLDLWCELMWIAFIPNAAATSGSGYAGLEYAAYAGGAIANAFYTLAVVMVGLDLWPRLGFWTALVAFTGLAFTFALVFEVKATIPALAGATILAYCAWVLKVAYR